MKSKVVRSKKAGLVKAGADRDATLVEAPYGGYITKEEYDRRYGGIDLEYFRKKMTPEQFRWFTRFIGQYSASTWEVDFNEVYYP